jgi:outer membrane protein TolC
MDWPQKVRIFSFLICCQGLLPHLGTAQPSQQAQMDYQAFLQRVKTVSLSLQRGKQLLDAAWATRSATELQDSPTLQLSNGLALQHSLGKFRQQHALALSATLWDFGRQQAQELRAQAQVEVSEAQLAEFEESLRAKTARFYVALQAAETIYSLAEEQLRNTQSKLQTVTAAYRRGERPQTDVIKLKVEEGRAQLFLSRAQDERAALAAQLLLATVDDTTKVENLDSVSLKPLPERNSSQWNAFFLALEKRTLEAATLLKLAANERVLRSELSALNAEKYPTIGSSAAMQANGTLAPIKPDVLAQLNLQYNIPLTSQRDYRRSALLARVKEVQLNQSEEKKNRQDKIFQSKVRAQGVLRTLELQRNQIETLLEYQKLVRTRYFAGRASLLELTTTEDDLLAQRLELARLQSTLYLIALDAADALGGKYFEELF